MPRSVAWRIALAELIDPVVEHGPELVVIRGGAEQAADKAERAGFAVIGEAMLEYPSDSPFERSEVVNLDRSETEARGLDDDVLLACPEPIDRCLADPGVGRDRFGGDRRVPVLLQEAKRDVGEFVRVCCPRRSPPSCARDEGDRKSSSRGGRSDASLVGGSLGCRRRVRPVRRSAIPRRCG